MYEYKSKHKTNISYPLITAHTNTQTYTLQADSLAYWLVEWLSTSD